jgi:hypothetical protein
MKKTDAAWLAGLLDGEGSIHVSTGSRNRVSLVPTVCVMMTTPSVLREIVRLTQVGRVSKGYNNGWGCKPIYKWAIVSRQAAQVLQQVVPCTRWNVQMRRLNERQA